MPFIWRSEKWAEDMNRHFSKGGIQMANRHMKRLLNITNHWRNSNQNYNEVPPVINKTKDNKCWQGCGEKGILVHCWWEYKLVQPLWKTVWRLLKKLKIELLYDPAISFLGIYPKELKSGSGREMNTPMFIVHCLQKPRCGNNLNAHLQINA